MMTIDDLAEICTANGLPIEKEQLRKLQEYAVTLREWNTKINLISRKDEENILERHILHSLSLLLDGPWRFNRPISRMLDLGTGGGLPGIPIAILRTDLNVTLIDSISKKIAACNAMIGELGLDNARAIAARTEELHRSQPNERYEVVVTRAVAPLSDLINWTARLRSPNAILLALKGGDLTAELDSAARNAMVQTVQAFPLRINAYSGFLDDQKQIVRVDFR